MSTFAKTNTFFSIGRHQNMQMVACSSLLVSNNRNHLAWIWGQRFLGHGEVDVTWAHSAKQMSWTAQLYKTDNRAGSSLQGLRLVYFPVKYGKLLPVCCWPVQHCPHERVGSRQRIWRHNQTSMGFLEAMALWESKPRFDGTCGDPTWGISYFYLHFSELHFSYSTSGIYGLYPF